MKLFLHGISALRWWARAASRPPLLSAPGSEALVECAPTADALRYVRRVAPFLGSPIHLLVPSRRDLRAIDGTIVHASAYPYPAGSFVRVANGLYAASPELAFIQAASAMPFLPLVKAGYALCGTFAEDPECATGLRDRRVLTSVQAVEEFSAECSKLYGAAAALRAISQVRNGSASPRESDLAMRLFLPNRWGGFGLPGGELNHRIDSGKRARLFASGDYYVADVCWPESKVVVEYDSDLHLTSHQLAHDAQKRGALEEDGYHVITVTKLQLDDPSEMEKIAKRIAKRLGRRLRIQVPDFKRRQRDLFCL